MAPHDRVGARPTVRAPVLMVLVCTALSFGWLCTGTSAAAAPATTGRATVVKVVDGDTLDVKVDGRTQRVRLIGLDAPEFSPPECLAARSRTYLTKLIAGRPIRLDADRTQADRDVYGRLLRHVVLSNGKVAAVSMIATGMAAELTYAEPYRYRSTFVAAQRTAQRKKVGIWSTSCPKPPLVSKPPAAPPTGCPIKGNISSSSGEKIYHVPGQRYYDETVITPSKGERWFCSEAAAVAAGWRKAKV